MDFTQLYNQLVADFGLETLPEEERDETLAEIAKTIQKQFLLDVYEAIGDDNFDALQASANMGEDFYNTTLKHLVPNYEEMFQAAREKVKTAFQSSN
jgi:biotin synthase-like enzyme